MNLVIFNPQYIDNGTSCERNSSYSFVPIVLKLCICFLHGMSMCMWFGYNCYDIFYHFFHVVNLVIFHPQYIDSGYLVSTTPHTRVVQKVLSLIGFLSFILGIF